MIKSSSFGSEFQESCGWWDRSKEDRGEWTYEGRRKAQMRLVETDGISARYQGSTYQQLYVEDRYLFCHGIFRVA